MPRARLLPSSLALTVNGLTIAGVSHLGLPPTTAGQGVTEAEVDPTNLVPSLLLDMDRRLPLCRLP